MKEVVRTEAFTGFTEFVNELGGNARDLLIASSIDPEALSRPSHYIPARNFILAHERAAAILNRADFGLALARRLDPGILGPLSLIMQGSATPRAALLHLQRYMHFHNTVLAIEVRSRDPDNDICTLDLTMSRPPKAVQYMERVVVSTYRLVTMFGYPISVRDVWFRHGPQATLAIYRSTFGVTPRFHAEENGIIFSRLALDTAQLGSNASLERLAQSYLDSVTPPPDALLARARLIIQRLLHDGQCTPTAVARTLGIQERTLQRRLQREGVTFEDVRDEERRAIAHGLLMQSGTPVSHIAQTLGFSEPSAFTRACRRWFGASPREIRKGKRRA